jgi:recombination protein RecA
MVIYLASEAPYREVDVIPTGMPNLDRSTGIGGVPTRRITEIYGHKSVGKSTLALQLVAQAQKEGRKCLWLDQEFTFDFGAYATGLGVNMEKLFFVREQIAEDALDDALSFAAKEKNSLIVIDSIGALHPRVEAEKSSDGKTIGSQSKLVSTFCRRIVPILMVQNHALFVINHSFADVMGHGVEKTSGGAKLDYHKALSIRLKNSFGKAVKRASDGAKIGIVIEAEIMKNKMAATQGSKIDLMMIPGQGFSIEHDKLADMIASGEVVKKGNSFFRGETKLGVGMKAARQFLKDETAKTA